jgi:hypothetical protein
VICAGEQIRMTGKAPRIYAKTGDNGMTPLSAFLRRLRLATFYQRRGWSRRLGNSLGQHPPARPARAWTANLVPIGGALDQ